MAGPPQGKLLLQRSLEILEISGAIV